MAPNEKTFEDVSATEKTSNTKGSAQKADKAGAGVVDSEKAIPEAETTVPGWAIMRPLRMRGLRSKAGGSSAASNADTISNAKYTNGIDSKADSDLKVTETNGSGDMRGEIEALHEVRSDDELLGDEEQQGRSTQRVIAGLVAEQINRNPSGGVVERTPSGHEYKVYKRRWFGLVQLALLNIVVSWDVSVTIQPASLCILTLASGCPSPRIRQRPPNTTTSLHPMSIG
jgi:FLVCR family MFS transporter 7